MMGTMFCQYETPCGWCTRLDKECTEKGGCKTKRNLKSESEGADQKIINPVGEYAVKFAENHGITINEAMQHPMVKAYAAAQGGINWYIN